MKTISKTITQSSDNESEEETDETLLRVQCIKGTHHNCIVCKQETRIGVSDLIRKQIWEANRMYVSNEYRICPQHLIECTRD